MTKMVEFFIEDPWGYDDDGYPVLDVAPEYEDLFGDGERRCAAGGVCAGLRQDGTPAFVGMLLWEDADSASGGGLSWQTCFCWEGEPNVLFCEDCASDPEGLAKYRDNRYNG